jgi:DNA primase
MGTHLNARQFEQLCDEDRTVYVTFDSDANGSGQHAADTLGQRLVAGGVIVRQVLLPAGHDPNSFLVQGGDARQFELLLEAARP